MTAETKPTADWENIVKGSPASSAAAKAAPASQLPPFPQGINYMVGRLPIKADTAIAIMQLPEPVKGVSCAVVIPNSGVLSDCYRPSDGICVPNVKRAYPINDREIKIITDALGDGKITGPGWTAGDFPGTQPKTRAIETGVPYVEAVLFIGVECGCDGENWASDTWG